VEARAHFEQAAQLDRETKNMIGEAASLRSLAATHQDSGKPKRALDLHLRALALDTDAGFEQGIAIDQANIGSVREHYAFLTMSRKRALRLRSGQAPVE